MTGYSVDRAFGDRHLPHAQSLVGFHLGTRSFPVASDYLDRKRATDLIWLASRQSNLHIAVRVRRSTPTHPYWKVRKQEITLRFSRPNGMDTEWSKVMDRGMGDYFFYGFSRECPGDQPLVPATVERYVLIDLAQLRLNRDTFGGPQGNPDGTSFKFVDLRSLPDVCIIGALPTIDQRRGGE